MRLGLKEGFPRAYLFLTCQFTDFVAKLVALALNGWRSTKLKLTLSSVWIYHIWAGVNNGQASTILAQSLRRLFESVFIVLHTEFVGRLPYSSFGSVAPLKNGRTHHLFNIRGTTLCHLGASFLILSRSRALDLCPRLIAYLLLLFFAMDSWPLSPRDVFPICPHFPGRFRYRCHQCADISLRFSLMTRGCPTVASQACPMGFCTLVRLD